MKLSKIMAGTGATRSRGPAGDPNVRAVICDSRSASEGSLFFALPGVKANGVEFARSAIARGAVAIVTERALTLPDALVFTVPNARRAMAVAAANFHGRPAGGLTLLGVTGTNGKTTTTYLVEAMLRAAGESAGVIGTVSYRFAGKELPAPHTTPESTQLQALLAEMKLAGTTTVVMEVSSHALQQDRVFGLSFTSSAFTNLTRDHLDFHGDMESYFAAKRKLFMEQTAGSSTINADDAWGVRLIDELTREGRTAWGFSASGNMADLMVRDATWTLDGCRGTLVTPRGEAPLVSRLVGQHNLENLLTATGLVLGAGFPLDAVTRGMASLENVPGRLERIEKGGVHLFVDYAHTDDALTRALSALRPLTRGRLFCVFGCGGDRDRGKRTLMAEAAGKASDVVIVTSDNPRTEHPQAIINEILPGFGKIALAQITPAEAKKGKRGYLVELDRREAIDRVVSLAKDGDVILLAGKGHEDYQVIGTEKLHFDDREEARRALGVV